MAEFNEQEEQKKDQQYLDGFNLGYQMQKMSEDKSLSGKDLTIMKSISNAMQKTQGNGDKMMGFKDGRVQFIQEREKAKYKELENQRSKNRDLER